MAKCFGRKFTLGTIIHKSATFWTLICVCLSFFWASFKHALLAALTFNLGVQLTSWAGHTSGFRASGSNVLDIITQSKRIARAFFTWIFGVIAAWNANGRCGGCGRRGRSRRGRGRGRSGGRRRSGRCRRRCCSRGRRRGRRSGGRRGFGFLGKWSVGNSAFHIPWTSALWLLLQFPMTAKFPATLPSNFPTFFGATNSDARLTRSGNAIQTPTFMATLYLPSWRSSIL